MESGQMRTVHRLTLALAVIALGAALPLAAQEPPGEEDAITQLQSKNVLTDEDTAAVRAWVAQRVQTIGAADPSGSTAAVKDLRGQFKGTQSFKQAYADANVEAIRAAYKRAKRNSAAQLIALLNTLNDESAAPLLIEALSDERVSVRSAAAIGLHNLRQAMADAGGTLVSESIAALRDAGQRETSPVALKLIYRAMDYTSLAANPNAQANAAALLALLEARGEQYAGRDAKAVGADRTGLELAGKLTAQLDEQGRRRLAIAAARMLHYAVTRYTTELYKIQDKSSGPLQISSRNRTERLIVTAEQLLSSLTAPPTKSDFRTVTVEMQEKTEDDKATDMKIAMNTWADSVQDRLQIDVHMDVGEGADEGEGDAPNP